MTWSVFSEEDFRKMVEHAPIGILIIDRQMKWQFVNQRFCDITGYSRDELAGKTFLDITFKDDIELNLHLYHQLLRGDINEYTYEKRYVRKNGQILWVRLAVAAVHAEGAYSHMVVSVEDIDATKKNQRMLEQKNDELDTLFYKASHDLKSPVTTLVGLCHLLRLEHKGLGENESFLHLEQTITRLKNQNESLLQLTRIQDWKPTIKTVSLSHLVNSIFVELPSRNAELKLTDLNVGIDTDDRLLGVAVKSILENGLIFKKPNTTPQLIVDYVRIPGQHKLTISDNGIGIPLHDLDHVLTMFYKASTHSSGNGMGLYIARKAVEKLSGEIVVSSTEGEGSSFSIFLPLN